jgi:hypothetical protein
MPASTPSGRATRREPRARRGLRRAFIAAPLIGSLVFLISIVFVVNVSKFEAGEVTQITSDAYHNRLVSVMEIYRTDLGAIFVENLGRTTESFIAGPCWSTEPLGIRYPNGYKNESAARLDGCLAFNSIIKAVIQSTDPRYGAHNWFMLLNENRSYEGLKFGPANPEVFKAFLQDMSGSSLTYAADGQTVTGYAIQDAGTLLKTLIQGSAFDCYAFAYGDGTPADPHPSKLQCCGNLDKVERGENCDGEVKPGCGSGVFYIALKIEDANVFGKMPRIYMDDGAGNVIRSGAIADRNIFVPVNYPLFRYYDDAFKFYNIIAYGKTSSAYPNGQGGVVNGFCQGPSCGAVSPNNQPMPSDAADNYQQYKKFDYIQHGNEEHYLKKWRHGEESNTKHEENTNIANQPTNDEGAIKDKTAEVFIGTVLSDAVENVTEVNDYHVLIENKNLSDTGLADAVQPTAKLCQGGNYCAYYTDPSLQVSFIDLAPEYRTSPVENRYCWYAHPEFNPQPT